MVLRTIISVNQLSIYGAVADMCDELACSVSDCSERTGEFVAHNNPETTVIPQEMMTTKKSLRTDEIVQDERTFANLPDHLQLIKLCSNVGITKTVAMGQYFTTLDDAELETLEGRERGSSREYTFPRDDPLSEVKGCIRGNTKIGPALQVVVAHHQGRYGIEIMIQSLLNDGTCSWVMIVNEINKYVTEMTEETQDDQAEDHSYIATAAERQRRENTWVLMLNGSGPNGPMNQRGDYAEAKKICQRLNQESGQAHHRLHPREQVRSGPDQPIACHDEGLERVETKTGWKWYDTQQTPSSSPQDGNRLRGGSLPHGRKHLKWSER